MSVKKDNFFSIFLLFMPVHLNGNTEGPHSHILSFKVAKKKQGAGGKEPGGGRC